MQSPTSHQTYHCSITSTKESECLYEKLQMRGSWIGNWLPNTAFRDCHFIWRPQNLSSLEYLKWETAIQHGHCPPEQVFNHFEFNAGICSKTELIRNLGRYYMTNEDSISNNYHIFDTMPTTYLIRPGLKDEVFHDLFHKFMKISDGNKGIDAMPAKHCAENYWIVKPPISTGGMGIEMTNNWEELQALINNTKYEYWVVQKYIERPLLYRERKFDLRVYVLVTAEMEIFIYKPFFLKIASEDYVLQKNNKYAHITNPQFQRRCQNFGDLELENCVSREELEVFLKREFPKKNISYEDHIAPRIRDIVIDTIMCWRNELNPRGKKNVFELFGYDFIIDEDLRTWLIGINENPAIMPSIMSKTYSKMMDDLLDIVLDTVHAPISEFKAHEQNDFEIIYSEKAPDSPEKPFSIRRPFDCSIYPLGEMMPEDYPKNVDSRPVFDNFQKFISPKKSASSSRPESGSISLRQSHVETEHLESSRGNFDFILMFKKENESMRRSIVPVRHSRPQSAENLRPRSCVADLNKFLLRESAGHSRCKLSTNHSIASKDVGEGIMTPVKNPYPRASYSQRSQSLTRLTSARSNNSSISPIKATFKSSKKKLMTSKDFLPSPFVKSLTDRLYKVEKDHVVTLTKYTCSCHSHQPQLHAKRSSIKRFHLRTTTQTCTQNESFNDISIGHGLQSQQSDSPIKILHTNYTEAFPTSDVGSLQNSFKQEAGFQFNKTSKSGLGSLAKLLNQYIQQINRLQSANMGVYIYNVMLKFSRAKIATDQDYKDACSIIELFPFIRFELIGNCQGSINIMINLVNAANLGLELRLRILQHINTLIMEPKVKIKFFCRQLIHTAAEICLTSCNKNFEQETMLTACHEALRCLICLGDVLRKPSAFKEGTFEHKLKEKFLNYGGLITIWLVRVRSMDSGLRKFASDNFLEGINNLEVWERQLSLIKYEANFFTEGRKTEPVTTSEAFTEDTELTILPKIPMTVLEILPFEEVRKSIEYKCNSLRLEKL